MAEKTRKKILIVEDDKDFLLFLRQSLSGEDFSVVYAINGEEGLALAEKEKPDLIVLDILLPKMDGITVAKKIKEKGIESQIIFLTNLKDAEHISSAVDAIENTEYIIKSDFHINDIVARIKNKLNTK